jgi:hypothetical protein
MLLCNHLFENDIGSKSLYVCLYCNEEQYIKEFLSKKICENTLVYIIKKILKFTSHDIIEKTVKIYQDISHDIVLRSKKRIKYLVTSLYLSLCLTDNYISQYEFINIINNNTNNKYNFNKNILHHGKKYIRENIKDPILFQEMRIFDSSIEELVRNILYIIDFKLPNENVKKIIIFIDELMKKYIDIVNNREEKSIIIYGFIEYSKTINDTLLYNKLTNIPDSTLKVSVKTLKKIHNDIKGLP